jgi:hypothetical protein
MLCIYEIATSPETSSYRVKRLDRPQAGHITNQSLHQLIKQYKPLHEEILVLLDEKHFVIGTQHYSHQCTSAYTAQELHDACVATRIHNRKEHHITAHQLYYHIDNITINGDARDYLIGTRGQLERDISCVYLHKYLLPMIEMHRDQIVVLPQSMATLHHIKHHITSNSFTALWINDEILKAVTVQNGNYMGARTIDRGKKKLVEMIAEQGLSEYFLNHNTQSNNYANQLLSESLRFYCDMITQWLQDDGQAGRDIVVIGDLIKHQLFMQVFQQIYHSQMRGYIVPLHAPRHPDKHIASEDVLYTLEYIPYLQSHIIPVG